MMARIKEGNSGQIVTGGNIGDSSNIFMNPFNSNQMKLDEEELNFIPFDHTSFS
jgi:hypothetical protein